MVNPVVRDEKMLSINGVDGRYRGATIGGKNYKPGTFTFQRWGASREYVEAGLKMRMRVEIRFDDDCRNGHNSFSITCDIDQWHRGAWREYGGGAAHDEIAKRFPELKPLIKWHLTSSDGPMHYVANTVYHASNRDHWGALKGQPYRFETALQFGDNPIKHPLKAKFAKFLEEAVAHPGKDRFDFEVIEVSERKKDSLGKDEYYRKWTFGGFDAKWYECPFDTEQDALDFLYALKHCDPQFVKIPTAWGEGKERNFEYARSSAVWPEATEEQLSLPKEELTALLNARLPALISEFRADIEAIGFAWSPEEVENNG